MTDVVEIRPIGFVENGVGDPVDEGWGGVVSEVALREDLAGALDGLEGFSHVLVVYWMHRAPPLTGALKRRPRGRQDMPELGLLAQRARHRPNPIGVTAAELLGVSGRSMTVRGLDAVDGTPVLDVKPYFPVFDHRDDAVVPGWAERLMDGYFSAD